MNSHYNAFISYRHHPDDIKVASEIHRSLERFRIPKSIRNKYGKITRLFRDKEELPITSDLNDEIDAALRNSDYLIVICSVHLKESIWCQKEIERFLKTHPRNRVLTVLASGEPYDVIPDILLHEDVVDPETGEVHRIDIEPLSCDWRSKQKKVKQDELLRLAAALLGCAYDELRQRQKQYLARRNTAIITAALLTSFSLTGYFLHTSITIHKANIQIQKNLDEALINQSRHLATAAQDSLAEGDRLTALALASAALPSENNPRPYVPEAERVLTEALTVYNTSSQLGAVGTVSPGPNVLVNDFCVSNSEKTMYLEDHRKMITTWDTNTLQKLGEITLTANSDCMIPLNNENLLVHNGMGTSTVSCHHPDGTLLWQMDHCLDMSYLFQQDQIFIIHQTNSGTYELLSISGTTGERIGQPLNLSLTDSELHATAFVTTPNADFALIQYKKGYFSSDSYYAIDLHTGKTQPLDLEFPDVSIITPEGYFVSMGLAEGSGISGMADGDRITSTATKTISCYNLHTGSLLWKSSITSPVAGVSSGIHIIHGSSNLLCTYGNIMMIVDGQTGETIAECGTGSIIQAVKETHAEEGKITFLLQDGYIATYNSAFNCSYESKLMEDNVSTAVVMDNFYSLHWLEDHVTVYRSMASAPAWNTVLEDGFYVSNNKLQVCDSYLAFKDSKSHFLFDLENKNLLHIMDNHQQEFLGFSSDGKKLWYTEKFSSFTSMDMTTGNCENINLELHENERISGNPWFLEDCLYYVVRNHSYNTSVPPHLVRWNLNTGEKNICSIQIDIEEDYSQWSWNILQTDGNYMWLLGNDKAILELDLLTETAKIIVPETVQGPVVTLHPNEVLTAISTGGTIHLKKAGEDSSIIIELENAIVGSMHFLEDVLLALCDNGFIYRYDFLGNLLGQTELSVGSMFSQRLLNSSADLSKLSWHLTQENDLVVNALGIGNVIDCDHWIVKATISDFLFYNESDHSLVCKRGNAIEGYTLYTTEQLLKIAKEDLGNFQMSQEQKDAYGIN